MNPLADHDIVFFPLAYMMALPFFLFSSTILLNKQMVTKSGPLDQFTSMILL